MNFAEFKNQLEKQKQHFPSHEDFEVAILDGLGDVFEIEMVEFDEGNLYIHTAEYIDVND